MSCETESLMSDFLLSDSSVEMKSLIVYEYTDSQACLKNWWVSLKFPKRSVFLLGSQMPEPFLLNLLHSTFSLTVAENF